MLKVQENKEVSYTIVLSEELAQTLKGYMQNSMYPSGTEPYEVAKLRESIFNGLQQAGVR